ncbi:hypothetical protein ACFQ0M_47555 [Kitasatospora aburaviensis]
MPLHHPRRTPYHLTEETTVRDWRRMQRDDFDENIPSALFPMEAPARPVPAEADACGTEALFGEPTAPAAPAAHQSQPPAVHRPRPVLIPP